jgi:hypothetical protein
MEEDQTYWWRRLEEERVAIEGAATPQSRRAHEQLFQRYAQALGIDLGSIAQALEPRAA